MVDVVAVVVVVVVVIGIGEVDVMIGPNLLSSCLCRTIFRVFSRRLGRGRKNAFVFSTAKRITIIPKVAVAFLVDLNILAEALA